MNPKVSYTLVGLFVLILGAGLITAAFWLSQAGSIAINDTYVCYMYESVSGLNIAASVTFRGVRVGEVRDIELDRENPQRVRILLDIERGIPITDETVAVIVSTGITGIAHIELSGGAGGGHLRPGPGQRYAEIKTGPSFLVRIDQAVTALSTELTSVTQNLNEVAVRVNQLLSDQTRGNAGIIADVETLTSTWADRATPVADRIQESLDDVAVILDNFARASDLVPPILEEVRQTIILVERSADLVNETIESFEETAITINNAAQTVDQVVAQAQDDITAFTRDTPATIAQLVSEMALLTEVMRRLTEDVETDPAMLLFGRPETAPGPGE
jgi:phospholipid/cholesterol/gamma-HCH transport system substrate-binding protein